MRKTLHFVDKKGKPQAKKNGKTCDFHQQSKKQENIVSPPTVGENRKYTGKKYYSQPTVGESKKTTYSPAAGGGIKKNQITFFPAVGGEEYSATDKDKEKQNFATNGRESRKDYIRIKQKLHSPQPMVGETENHRQRKKAKPAIFHQQAKKQSKISPANGRGKQKTAYFPAVGGEI